MYFIATFLTCLSLQSPDQQLPYTYQDEDGVFSVKFPGKPTETSSKNASGATKIVGYAKARKYVLAVSITTINEEHLKELNEDEVFEQAVAEYEALPEVELESVEVIKKGKIPGRKVIAKGKDDADVVLYFYLVNKRLYAVNAMRSADDASKAIAESFLRSFKLDVLPFLYSSVGDGFKSRFPAKPTIVNDGLVIKDAAKVVQYLGRIDGNRLSITSVSYPKGYVSRRGRASIFREQRRSISVEPFTKLKKISVFEGWIPSNYGSRNIDGHSGHLGNCQILPCR